MSIDQKDSNENPTPRPDFYIENGLYVFTEAYHLKRGHCCENACRHCPWKDTILPSAKLTT